jgi:hypothetical protein
LPQFVNVMQLILRMTLEAGYHVIYMEEWTA